MIKKEKMILVVTALTVSGVCASCNKNEVSNTMSYSTVGNIDVGTTSYGIMDSIDDEVLIQETENESKSSFLSLYDQSFDDMVYTLGGNQTLVHYPSTAGLEDPIVDDNSLLEFSDEHQRYHLSIRQDWGDSALDTLRDRITTMLWMTYGYMTYDDVAAGKNCFDFGAELEELTIAGRTVYKVTYNGEEDDDYMTYVTGYCFNVGDTNIVIIGYTNNRMLSMFGGSQDDYIKYINDLADYLLNNIEITEDE